MIKQPLTIEVFGLKDGVPVVLDRVIGGSLYLDEAKRIGRRLFSIVDAQTRPEGYRILGHDHELIYNWQAGQADEGDPRASPPLK
jgi:hypothetical protein